MKTLQEEKEEFLAHAGVKGMRWGKRKAEDTRPAKLSRKEVKAEKNQFYQDKANSLVAKALKDPQVLISLKTGDIYPTIVTGKQFVEHLSNGGLLNIKMTDVYAQQASPKGQYILNQNPNQGYKRSDGR